MKLLLPAILLASSLAAATSAQAGGIPGFVWNQSLTFVEDSGTTTKSTRTLLPQTVQTDDARD